MTVNLMKECLSVHYYDIFLKLESSFKALKVAGLPHIHFSSVANVLYGFMYIALLHCLNNCKLYSFLTLLFVWFNLPCFVIRVFKYWWCLTYDCLDLYKEFCVSWYCNADLFMYVSGHYSSAFQVPHICVVPMTTKQI